MVSRSRWWIETASFLVVVAWTGCGRPSPAPFTRAETDRALAPARDLWSRCYAGTVFERNAKIVTVEYRLNVARDGQVRSVPTLVDPEDPWLVECVRCRLDELRFPARGKDHVAVRFELGPKGVENESTPRDARAGSCDPACSDGFSCHYEAASSHGVCRVAPGRCRFERDCPPSQACQRLAEPLGVCAERNP